MNRLIIMSIVICTSTAWSFVDSTTQDGPRKTRPKDFQDALLRSATIINQCDIDYCIYDSKRRPCGRAVFSKTAVTLKAGLDCSAYISAIMASVGYKIHPQNGHPQHFNTTTASLKDSQCLKKFQATPRTPILPGDIINAAGNPGHVVMIGKVGADPFGLRQARRNGCAINPANFNFSVNQSSRSGGGPHETHPAKLGRKTREILIQAAQELCRISLSGNDQGFVTPAMRRIDPTDPKCVTKPLPKRSNRC